MYYFIVNPKSRTGLGAQIWQSVQAQLKKQSLPYESFFTEYRGHATRLARHICRRAGQTPAQGAPYAREAEASALAGASADFLIVIGGDGTIQETLSGIPENPPVIFGYIPAGSGNDFARSMKIPQDPAEALRLILSGSSPFPMDMGLLKTEGRSSSFGISCGMGFDAAICHAALASRLKALLNRLKLGKLTYALLALRLLFAFRPFSLETEVDGKKYSFRKVYFTSVMNQPYEGGGFLFCPDARPHDHTLDLIVIHGMSKLKLLLCLPTAFWGRHTRFRGVTLLKGRRILLVSDADAALHQDGESAGIGRRMEVSLRKSLLPVMCSRP